MTQALVAFLALAALFILACATTPAPEPSVGPASAAPTGVSEFPPPRSEMLVEGAWLQDHLPDQGLVVLHVGRTRETYAAAHIPGARFVALSDIVTTVGGVPNEMPPLETLTALVRRLGIDETSRIIVYEEEAGLLAARAYVALDCLGLGDQSSLLDGQLRRWRAEGRPLTADDPAVAPTTFSPTPRPEILVTLAEMRDLSLQAAGAGGGPIAILDSRPDAQYTGADPGEAIGRPGHIPGAASLFWHRTIASPDDPVLLPVDELRSRFAAAGAAPGDRVITYCRTGMQASHAYFVSRYLGFDTRLYDGSFVEWSAADDAPVAMGPNSSSPAP